MAAWYQHAVSPEAYQVVVAELRGSWHQLLRDKAAAAAAAAAAGTGGDAAALAALADREAKLCEALGRFAPEVLSEAVPEAVPEAAPEAAPDHPG